MDKKPKSGSADEYEKHIAESDGEYLIRTNGKYEDLIAKILCVLAAIVLWFYVVITDTAPQEKVFTGIDVKIRNTDTLIEGYGLSVISGHDNTVDITLVGTKNELNRLSLDNISAWVDAGEITTAGDYTLEINTDLPPGVTVGSMSANFISVNVDKRITVSLPIEVVPNYTIDASYTLGTPELSIEEVNISGPAEELEKLDHARVRIDLGKVSKSTTSTGTLELIDNSGSVFTSSRIRMQTTEVSVYYPVYTFKDVPLTVSYKYGYFNSSNVDITITPSTVRVKGDPAVLESMSAITLTQLDEKRITDNATQSATINLPTNVERVTDTRTATISVKHKGTTTRTLEIWNFNIENPNNLEYMLGTEAIRVTFRGTNALLSSLTPYNVRANIDLGYLNNASGTVEVPVTIALGDDISGSVYEVGEYRMSVTIAK